MKPRKAGLYEIFKKLFIRGYSTKKESLSEKRSRSYRMLKMWKNK